MITLIPMTESDYRSYLETAVVSYAQDKVDAGNWTESEALERSRQEFQKLLPQGNHTEANFLFTLVNGTGQQVGYLWYNLDPHRPDFAFIYDFEIYEQFRRQGYATQALKVLETHAKPKGVKKLGLHVFGYNTAARELYKRPAISRQTSIWQKKSIRRNRCPGSNFPFRIDNYDPPNPLEYLSVD
jgi:ribosomal protein S18 acetylase RimI-like enzyme